MSSGDRQDDRGDRDDGSPSEMALRALLQRGGPRPAPPPADEAEIRAAVLAEWNAVTGRRVRAGRAWRAAAAVGATAVVASLVMLSGERPPSGPAVAHAERVRGAIEVAGGGDDSGALESDEALFAGATLATNEGEAALRLAAGGSLRLAPGTRLVLAADGTVELLAGKLYFDSENARDAAPAFAVVTAAGSLHDVGTQFMVTAERGSVELGVREGRVAWRTQTSGAAVEASAGERLAAGADGRIERGTIATFGTYWAWAERLAPPFSLDGRRVSEVVARAAAQTGRRVVYADANVEAEADTVVHIAGAADLEPLEQLARAMAVTGFEYRIEAGTIVVTLQ